MILPRILAAAGLLFLLGAAPGLALEPGVYFPKTFTLANGLQVVVVTNHRAPVVTQMVWYKVGGADEVAGHSGLAHFLEHLMFKGTDTLAPGAFSRAVSENGGRDNAFTSHDFTAYYETVARDRLEMVMGMEADRMAHLKLTDDVVLPERDVVLEERRQRVGNDPADRIGEQVEATVFVHHPYGIPVLGWPDEMAAMTRQDAEAFYRRWYAPNNAILVVAGDAGVEEVKPLAEKYFGPLPARPLPERRRAREPDLQAARRVILTDAEVRQPILTRLWHAPSFNEDPDHQAYALEVLNEIMSGGATGRLYRRLVVERKLATSASMDYSPLALNATTLGVTAVPADGVAMGDLEAAVEEEIARLLKDGVDAQEVAVAKRRMLAAAAYARDSLTGPAHAFGQALTTGRSIDDVENWPVRLDAVTVDEVNRAARAVLGRTNHVTGLLLAP